MPRQKRLTTTRGIVVAPKYEAVLPSFASSPIWITMLPSIKDKALAAFPNAGLLISLPILLGISTWGRTGGNA
jgi:hypothetical protein